MTDDQIRISDLLLRCIVGIDDRERMEKQDVMAQIVLHLDLSKACRTDQVADTVDYRALKREILSMAENSRFYLIEALAQRIADICLEDPRVRLATVTVEKPAALRFARTVGVTITRDRSF